MDQITRFTFSLITCSISAFPSVPFCEQVIKLMKISIYLIFHIFIVFPKTPQKRRSFPPPPPRMKTSSRFERKFPSFLPYMTNYSKLCLNCMFFTSIVSHFLCASEVLRTNRYFAELESQQAPDKSSILWKSGTRVNVTL